MKTRKFASSMLIDLQKFMEELIDKSEDIKFDQPKESKKLENAYFNLVKAEAILEKLQNKI